MKSNIKQILILIVFFVALTALAFLAQTDASLLPTSEWRIDQAMWDGQTLTFEVELVDENADIRGVSCETREDEVIVSVMQSMVVLTEPQRRTMRVTLTLPPREAYALKARGNSSVDVTECPVMIVTADE